MTKSLSCDCHMCPALNCKQEELRPYRASAGLYQTEYATNLTSAGGILSVYIPHNYKHPSFALPMLVETQLVSMLLYIAAIITLTDNKC